MNLDGSGLRRNSHQERQGASWTANLQDVVFGAWAFWACHPTPVGLSNMLGLSKPSGKLSGTINRQAIFRSWAYRPKTSAQPMHQRIVEGFGLATQRECESLSCLDCKVMPVHMTKRKEPNRQETKKRGYPKIRKKTNGVSHPLTIKTKEPKSVVLLGSNALNSTTSQEQQKREQIRKNMPKAHAAKRT